VGGWSVSTSTTDTLLEGQESAPPVAGEIAARSPMQLFWRRLKRDKVALTALAIVAAMLLMAILAPVIVRVLGLPDPNLQNDDLLGDFGEPVGPMDGHPLGVDERGRDVASRVIYGSRVSLEVAFIATAFTVVIGVTAGLVTGFYRGWVDTLVSRVMDLFLAFPVLVLAVGLGVACADGCAGGAIQPGLPVVIFVIVLTTWPYMARIVRGQVLSLKNQQFIHAARSLGQSHTRIAVRHLLPNLIGIVVVYLTLTIPAVILDESFLSFLGLGIQSPQASWGSLLSEGAQAINPVRSHWWLLVFPAAAMSLTLLALNFLGDGLRDALDPRRQR
jgi:peptide/nickel transport system permease protein